MASQSSLVNDYLYRQNIPHLFEVSPHFAGIIADTHFFLHAQSLMTAVVYHKPEDPIAFLQNCLKEAKRREGQYTWNCFITTTNSRSVFSRTKPLPPIQMAAASNTTKENEKSQETATEEHTVPTTGEDRSAAVQDKPLVFIIGTHMMYFNLVVSYNALSVCRWSWMW